MSSFTTNSLAIGPFASYDLDLQKEDKLYRTALHYSLSDMIESMNYLIQNNIANILKGVYLTNKGNTINVKDVEITYPQFETEEGTFWSTPFIARQTGSNYMSSVRIIYTETKKIDQNNPLINKQAKLAGVTSEIKSRKIGSFHAMVGSCRDICQFKPIEYKSKEDWMITLGECPSSVGCYTINNGNEKTISMDQKLKTSIFMSFMTNDDHPRLETRITLMHNSMTSIVRMQIGKHLPNIKVLLPFLKGAHIPLYLVFYLVYYDFVNHSANIEEFSTTKFATIIANFGPTKERERIISYLASSKKKFETFFLTLKSDGQYHPDLTKISEYIHGKMKKPKSTGGELDTEKYTIKYIVEIVSKELFVPCKTFKEKITNLCYMACQTIRCAIGTRKLDSRDDLSNQKVDSFIRMIATYCTSNLLNAIRNEVEDKGFNYGKGDRKDTIVESRKCITLNETIGEMCKISNRVNTRTSSITLRQVSEDQLPNICPVKTPDGITCGLIKQKSALSHISDNREYEINRMLPINDLFQPHITYISNKLTPEFKYRFSFVTVNNNILPLYYAPPGSQPTNDNLFVSTRILNIFNTLIEEKKATYYIDDDSVIYMKFLLEFNIIKYSFQTHLGGILYADIPHEILQEFSVVADSTPNPDYKSCSSILPLPGCEMTIGFRWSGDPNNVHTVTVVHGDNKKNTFLNVSDFFISLLKNIIAKGDIISNLESNGNHGWVVTTNDPLMFYSYTHWSGSHIAYMIPAHMERAFKVIINVVNEYISYEKSKTYSASFSFNGSTIVDPNTGEYYPKVVWFDGKKTENYFRIKRRLGILPYDSFVYYNELDNHVGYYDDPGRIMSPMLIVDNNGDLVIDKLKSWDRFNGYDYDKSKQLIRSLYKEGSLEMIDAKEMDSTLLATDINECRGFNKLRKFLNMVDLKQINSSLFKIIGSNYIKNEDITSVIINGNHHDIEFSTETPPIKTYSFIQDDITYYGSYVIRKNVGTKLKKPVQKLVKPTNGTIMDTYHLIYRDLNSKEFFDSGDFKFITDDMDPEFDGTYIYIYDTVNDHMRKYEVFTLNFNKKAGEENDINEIFIDDTCAIVNVNLFTRPSFDKSHYYVVDGKIIDESQLVDTHFYVKTDENNKQKYIVPDEYIFPENELTTIFDLKKTKIHRHLNVDTKNIIMFNHNINSYPKGDHYDPREARLYNATIRRFVEDLSQIPDSVLSGQQMSLNEQFHILSLLKKNINEFGVKRYIAIIREFLNTEFKFTHCLVDPNQAYSFIANFVPRGGSNPGPRWSYQSSMGVQALGVGNTVHYRRFETSIKRLISPTEHSFETVAELPLNQVQMPITQNFTFLVAANYKGFEDPIIISKAALEKFGRYEKEVCIKIIESKNTHYTESLSYPTYKNGDPKTGHIFRHLDKNGLPKLGSRIVVGDCVIGRSKIYTTVGSVGNSDIKKGDSSFLAGVGTEGIVTAVHVIGSENANNGFRTIIVKLSQRRKQQVGDKMTARFSQKGTIGDIIGGMINDGDPRLRIVDNSLMPYITSGPSRGLRAEIIFNPASFPSRMTCGLIDEILCSKASLYIQEKIDASSFHTLDRDYFRDALWENSLFKGVKDFNGEDFHMDVNASEILSHSDGEVIMDPSTGRPRQFYIGIVAYQFLKHHVVDKETARFRGTVKPITHQPEEGRHIRGGQRMGEMERDAIISVGASGVLFDRFMKCSDGYIGIYCFKCKNDSSVSNLNSKICQICGSSGSLTSVEEPRIYKVLRHQMAAIGLNILQTLKPVDDFDADKLRGNLLNGTANVIN